MKKFLLGIAFVLALGGVKSHASVNPHPQYGGEIEMCGWRGVFPPYLPTGSVGVNGIQVEASCYYFNTLTGGSSSTFMDYWWIPWSTWFLPFAQTATCEVANYPSFCNNYGNPSAKYYAGKHPVM